jgi:hypothetical protein
VSLSKELNSDVSILTESLPSSFTPLSLAIFHLDASSAYNLAVSGDNGTVLMYNYDTKQQKLSLRQST